jgi:hypothetical protein
MNRTLVVSRSDIAPARSPLVCWCKKIEVAVCPDTRGDEEETDMGSYFSSLPLDIGAFGPCVRRPLRFHSIFRLSFGVMSHEDG